jgi:hypothetical protein
MCNKKLTPAADSALYFGPFFLSINTMTRSSLACSRKKCVSELGGKVVNSTMGVVSPKVIVNGL